ncbi:MAG: cbb3-type cytochrome oxidase subunit 3 [Comamonas sp.]
MDITTMRIVATLASFACFLGIAAWAYAGRNRARFEQDALLPFQDGETAQPQRELP